MRKYLLFIGVLLAGIAHAQPGKAVDRYGVIVNVDSIARKAAKDSIANIRTDTAGKIIGIINTNGVLSAVYKPNGRMAGIDVLPRTPDLLQTVKQLDSITAQLRTEILALQNSAVTDVSATPDTSGIRVTEGNGTYKDFIVRSSSGTAIQTIETYDLMTAASSGQKLVYVQQERALYVTGVDSARKINTTARALPVVTPPPGENGYTPIVWINKTAGVTSTSDGTLNFNEVANGQAEASLHLVPNSSVFVEIPPAAGNNNYNGFTGLMQLNYGDMGNPARLRFDGNVVKNENNNIGTITYGDKVGYVAEGTGGTHLYIKKISGGVTTVLLDMGDSGGLFNLGGPQTIYAYYNFGLAQAYKVMGKGLQ